jgi:hypothetical protein
MAYGHLSVGKYLVILCYPTYNLSIPLAMLGLADVKFNAKSTNPICQAIYSLWVHERSVSEFENWVS